MARSLDGLIEFLLDDIALAGEKGIGKDDVFRSVKIYYASSDSNDTSQAGASEEQGVLKGGHIDHTEGEQHQMITLAFGSVAKTNAVLIDEPFLQVVWKWLTAHSDVRLVADGKDERRPSKSQRRAQKTAAGVDQEATPPEKVPLPLDEAARPSSSPSVLHQSNDPDTRVKVTQERIWHALTGHNVDLQRCPPSEFALLSIIASHREPGVTQTDLVKLAEQDKRSVPKRTEALQNKGYIEKRAVFTRSIRTSLLIHKRFTKSDKQGTDRKTSDLQEGNVGIQEGSEAWTGDRIDALAFVKALFRELQRTNLVTHNELKQRLGVFRKAWHSRVLSRLIRKLELMGCLRRVMAASGISKGKLIHRCVKLIREPEGKEWELFWDTTIPDGLETVDDDDQGGDANDADGKVEDLEPVLEEKEALVSTTRRLPPQWTPNRGLANIITDVLRNAGTDGASTMSLRAQVVGAFYERPFASILDRLTEQWELAQPPHLRYLAILRDAAQIKRVAFYKYFNYENFQRLVNSGDATWESVKHPVKDTLNKRKRGPEIDGKDSEVDSFGFSIVASSKLLKNGNATLRECLQAAKVGPLYVVPSNSTSTSGGLDKALAGRTRGRPRKPEGSGSRGAPGLPKSRGRPRKYPKGEEPYRKEVQDRLKEERKRQAAESAEENLEISAESRPEKRARVEARPTQTQADSSPSSLMDSPFSAVITTSSKKRKVVGSTDEAVNTPNLPHTGLTEYQDGSLEKSPVNIGDNEDQDTAVKRRKTAGSDVRRPATRNSRPLSVSDSVNPKALSFQVFINHPGSEKPKKRGRPKKGGSKTGLVLVIKSERLKDPSRLSTIPSEDASRYRTPDLSEATLLDSTNGDFVGSSSDLRPQERAKFTPLDVDDITFGGRSTKRQRTTRNTANTSRQNLVQTQSQPPTWTYITRTRAGVAQNEEADVPESLHENDQITMKTDTAANERAHSPEAPLQGDPQDASSAVHSPTTRLGKQLDTSATNLHNSGEEATQGSIETANEKQELGSQSGGDVDRLAQSSNSITSDVEEKPAPKIAAILAKGSLNLQRKKLVLGIVDSFGGVYPGDRDLWFCYSSRWIKENPHAGRPDPKTVKNVQKALLDSGQLISIVFAFQNSKGIMCRKTLLTKPEIPSNSSIVIEWQKKLRDADGDLYSFAHAASSPKERKSLENVRQGGGGTLPTIKPGQETDEIVQIPGGYRKMQLARRRQQRIEERRLKREEKQQLQRERLSLRFEQQFINLSAAERNEATKRIREVATSHKWRNIQTPRASKVTRLDALHRPPAFGSSANQSGASEAASRWFSGGVAPPRKFPTVYPPLAQFGHPGKPGKASSVAELLINDSASVFHPSSGTFGTFQGMNDVPPMNPSGGSVAVPHTAYGLVDQSLRRVDERNKRSHDKFVLDKSPNDDPFGDGGRESSKRQTLLNTEDRSHLSISQQLQSSSDTPIGTRPVSLDNLTMYVPANSLSEAQKGTSKSILAQQYPRPPRQSSLNSSGLETKRQRSNFRKQFKTRSLTAAPFDLEAYEASKTQHEQNTEGFSNPGSLSGQKLCANLRLASGPPKPHRVVRARTAKLSESEERKFLISVTIIRVLVGGLDRHIDWVLVSRLLPNFDQATLQKKWNPIYMKNRLQLEKLQADFQEAYVTAYREKKVPRINYDDLENYDWEALVRWVEKNLESPRPKSQPSLPRDRRKFESLFELREDNEKEKSWRNDYFSKDTPMYKRQALVSGVSHSLPVLAASRTSETPNDHQLRLARSLVRANIITPQESYNAGEAKTKLLSLGEDVVKTAVDQLLTDRVIVHAHKGRVSPGRNFDVSDNFVQSLKRVHDEDHFRKAATYKSNLDASFKADGFQLFSYHAADADVMAAINLVANGRVKMVQQNPPMNRFGLTDGSYRTRMMDKSRLNFEIELRPTSTYLYGSPLSDIPPPPAEHLHDENLPVPLWYDIHGTLVVSVWMKALAAVLVTVSSRPGVLLQDMERETRPAMEAWEIELILEWMLKAKAVKKICGGWATNEWWWMLFPPMGT
ncbi:MAG: hypothetical protein M4579_002947 [Chaenotheca gracillima]|nr:MAG: hypothetical protein M4579_002947 [Chaenotheca gracillima]